MAKNNKKQNEKIVELALLASQNKWIVRSVASNRWLTVKSTAVEAVDYCCVHGLDIQVKLNESEEIIIL